MCYNNQGENCRDSLLYIVHYINKQLGECINYRPTCAKGLMIKIWLGTLYRTQS